MDDYEKGCGAVRERRYKHRYMAGKDEGKRQLGKTRGRWKTLLSALKRVWNGLD
jgi:hypothetical protein